MESDIRSTHMPVSDLKQKVSRISNAVVLILSLALIIYISVDTFNGLRFMRDRFYMTFQLWVCVIFIISYFIGLWVATDKPRYICSHALFLFLSIPWLNIVEWVGWQPEPGILYLLRFVPLARGALAMTIVVRAVSRDKVTGIFFSYTFILLAIIYFGSLIFFERESSVNPMVPDFWAALWWAAMDATTSGSNINPVTPVGKATGCVISVMGMIMFPLFTVYITDTVRRKISKLQANNQRSGSAAETANPPQEQTQNTGS